ncbi:hypothetical protein [Variovorax sp. RO1]|uniref:hypothetical protein n=1 Tax=Variovorax sp. RO1 TaxID=2066034 RepID=UPI001180AD44|nr:hypothetical protein [Variovorax sp. RO1]
MTFTGDRCIYATMSLADFGRLLGRRMSKPTLELSGFDGTIEGHPDLTALFKVILNAEPVMTSVGKQNGRPIVGVGNLEEPKVLFIFTQTDEGYTLTRSR